MKNYQITIGLKSVICVDVKADTEEEAKDKALSIFRKQKEKMTELNHVNLQDDTYGAHGVLNMDETWNAL